MMEQQKPIGATLAKKLAVVLSQVGYVQKDGRNDYHKYTYVTEAALADAVRSRLAEQGVMVFTSVDRQWSEGSTTFVETSHTFACGETGDAFTVRSQGAGQDKGDKGVYKAITGAMKYFLYKNFLISTGDDPESDASVDRPAQGSSNGSNGSNGTSAPNAAPRRQQSAPKPPAKKRPNGGDVLDAEARKKMIAYAQEQGVSLKRLTEMIKTAGYESMSVIPRADSGRIKEMIDTAA